VWKSNPPFDPRRTESPALKAGKVTGLFSPPKLPYHDYENAKIINVYAGPGKAFIQRLSARSCQREPRLTGSVLPECYNFGNGIVQVGNRQARIALPHGETALGTMLQEFRDGCQVVAIVGVSSLLCRRFSALGSH